MAMTEEDDDVPRLDPSTLAALQDFYGERDTRQKQFEDLKNAAEEGFSQSAEVSMDMFGEDWNASQFWYTDATADTLAQQLLDDATAETQIAIISAPSVYVAMRKLLQDQQRYPARPRVVLLEFDERFAVFKDDFVRYDFQEPLKLDTALKANFDRIICDPPFLSDDCQTKTALTARWMAKSWADTKVIVCTGERMENLIHQLYGKTGLKTTTFLPEHSKGLSNEFRCYANFDCKTWTLQQKD
ncbi:Protein-lysine N-methyltransferase EFM5-like protein [Elsinoe fawcettii]|nr:Protein-lysine N-methyltransferase EFM5-like protein [Elsinoe fawcettii]